MKGSGSRAIVLGNGPSLTGFDFNRLRNFDVFGMNAAYRFWDRIGWYPQYYSCLDLVVGLSHAEQIARLIENAETYGIRKFLLRRNLIEKLAGIKNLNKVSDFDLLKKEVSALDAPTISTGSHTAAWAAHLGYKEIFLLGIDCNYVEIIQGAIRREGVTLEIAQDIAENPNYFFSDYQRKGDRYNTPNPGRDIHIESWSEIAERLPGTGARITNANLKSKLHVFKFCEFSDVERGGPIRTIAPEVVLADVRRPLSREAKASIDETAVVARLLQERVGPQHVMVDVGAHFGGSAIHFDKLGWRVLCFEPDPSNREKLERRFGKSDNVTIDPRAVSDKPATGLAFFTSEESTGISGLHVFRQSHVQTATVDATTIEEIVDDNSLASVDFLKIDVEGFDFAVLRGVPWNKLKPDVIECEFEDAKTLSLGHTYKDVADYLVSKGYTVYLSEWHPIVRYGVPHDWCRIIKYPEPVSAQQAWGNILAFRDDPGMDVVERAFKVCLAVKSPGVLDSAPLSKRPRAPARAARKRVTAKGSSSGAVTYDALTLAEEHVGQGGSYRHLNLRADTVAIGARTWNKIWFKFQKFGDSVLVELRPADARPVLFQTALPGWPSDGYGPYQRLRLDPKGGYVDDAISLANSLDPADREVLLTFLVELPSLFTATLEMVSGATHSIWSEMSNSISEFSTRVAALSPKVADPVARPATAANGEGRPKGEPHAAGQQQPPNAVKERDASESQPSQMASNSDKPQAKESAPAAEARATPAEKPQPAPAPGNGKPTGGAGSKPAAPAQAPPPSMSFGGYLEWSQRAISRRPLLSLAAALVLAGLGFAAFTPGLAAQQAVFLPLFLFGLACLGIVCATGYAGSLVRRADQRASGGAQAVRAELGKLIAESSATIKAQRATDAMATKSLEQLVGKLGQRVSGSEALLRNFDEAVGVLRQRLTAMDDQAARRAALEVLASEVAQLRTAVKDSEVKQTDSVRKLIEQDMAGAAQLASANTGLRQLGARIDELTSLAGATEARLSANFASKEQVARLKHELGGSLEAHAAALASLEPRLEELQSKAEGAEATQRSTADRLAELEILISAVGGLSEEFAKLRADADALNDIRPELEVLKSRASARDAAQTSIANRLVELEILIAAVGALSEELAELRTEAAAVNDIRPELEVLKSKASAQDAAGREVGRQVTALQASLANLAPKAAIEALKRDVARHADRIEEFDPALARLLTLDAVADSIAEMQQLLAGHADELQELKPTVQSLAAHTARLQAAEQAIGRVAADGKAFSQSLETTRSEQAGLQREVKAASTRQTEAGQALEKMANELAKLRAEIAAFNQRYGGLDEVTGKLQDGHHEIETRLRGVAEHMNAIMQELPKLALETAQARAAADKAEETGRSLVTSSPAMNFGRYRKFNRQLTSAQIDRLRTTWARWLSIPASAQSLGYAAHRICTLESQMYGRLATSIEDIMVRSMVAQAVKRPRVDILEIGTLFGIGAISMADSLRRDGKSVRLTLIDPLEGYYGLDARDVVTGQPVSESALYENLRIAGIGRSEVTLVKHLSTSDEALEAVRQKEYDVLVLDGDHSYAGVKADFENYFGLIRLGGYIVFDDYGVDEWPDIKRYVDEAMPFRSEVALVGCDWRTAVYRVVKKPERQRRPAARASRGKGSRSAK